MISKDVGRLRNLLCNHNSFRTKYLGSYYNHVYVSRDSCSFNACCGFRKRNGYYSTDVLTSVIVPKQMERFKGFHCTPSGNICETL